MVDGVQDALAPFDRDTDRLSYGVDLYAQDLQARLVPQRFGGGELEAKGTTGQCECVEREVGSGSGRRGTKEIVQVVLDRVGRGRLDDPVKRLREEIEKPRRAAPAKGESRLHVEEAVKGKAKETGVVECRDNMSKGVGQVALP